MSLYSRCHGKKETSKKKEIHQTRALSQSSAREIKEPDLPSDWREKLHEMCQTLEKMRERGYGAANRHKMNDHEFETFMNNPANFGHDEWNMICQAKERAHRFLHQMKVVLANSEIGVHENKNIKKQKPRRGPNNGVGHGWISVD